MEQERPPDLLLVADDGSTDGTLRLLDAMQHEGCAPMKVLRHERNLGLRRNVERALRACPPGVVVLADHDDVWDPQKLGIVQEAFVATDALLWFSDAELMDEAGLPLGRSAWEAVHFDASAQARMRTGRGVDRLMYGMTVVGATMAFRTELLDWALPLPPELEGDNHLFLHDGWLSVLGSVAGGVVIEPRRLVHYRQHMRQITAMSLFNAPDSQGVADQPNGVQMEQEHARLVLVNQRLREVAPNAPPARQKALALARQEAFLSDRLALRRETGGDYRQLQTIGRHVANGDYFRYARGLFSAAKDCAAAVTGEAPERTFANPFLRR